MVMPAGGELRIEINRVPLASVQQVWDLDQQGSGAKASAEETS
jgi:hypothetical protein